jgi:hypothetical protein
LAAFNKLAAVAMPDLLDGRVPPLHEEFEQAGR